MKPQYLISPSQFRTHKECPQKHEYVYGKQLRPKRRERHFEVGSYFHELAHFYYQLIKSGYKVGDPHTVAAMDSKMRTDLELVQHEFLNTLLQVHLMFRRYLERRTEKIDGNIEVLEVEKELIYELDEFVGLQGIVDLIYKQHGKVWIRDHKTGEKKASHSEESVEVDDQLLVYAIIWWKQTGIIPGIEISWVNSKVDYKNPPTNDQLFGRYRKTLSKEYLEGFWQYTLDYVYHMRSTPVIRYLNSWKCKGCPFKDACTMQLRGVDTQGILDANFKVVPRNHDYRKFTDIARAKAGSNQKDSERGSSDGGWNITINKS